MTYSTRLDISDRTDMYMRLTAAGEATELYELLVKNKDYIERYQHPWVGNITLEKSEESLTSVLAKIEEGIWLQYRIIVGEKIVGNVGLYDRNNAINIASLGYWIDKDQQHHGYVAAAVRRLAEYGFEVWNLQKIYFEIMAENTPSQHVVQKCGARLTDIESTSTKYDKEVTYQIWELAK